MVLPIPMSVVVTMRMVLVLSMAVVMMVSMCMVMLVVFVFVFGVVVGNVFLMLLMFQKVVVFIVSTTVVNFVDVDNVRAIAVVSGPVMRVMACVSCRMSRFFSTGTDTVGCAMPRATARRRNIWEIGNVDRMLVLVRVEPIGVVVTIVVATMATLFHFPHVGCTMLGVGLPHLLALAVLFVRVLCVTVIDAKGPKRDSRRPTVINAHRRLRGVLDPKHVDEPSKIAREGPNKPVCARESIYLRKKCLHAGAVFSHKHPVAACLVMSRAGGRLTQRQERAPELSQGAT